MELIQANGGPQTPHYPEKSKRCSSFKNWPKNHSQTPEILAEAGFISQGIGDCVQCFYCNGALNNWTPEDVPWVEHAKWFGDCAFVRLKMSGEFVEWIKAAQGSLDKDKVQRKIR